MQPDRLKSACVFLNQDGQQGAGFRVMHLIIGDKALNMIQFFLESASVKLNS